MAVQKFFHAVKKGSQIGDGTVGDLVDWLERYVNILFPDNGIEYWADNRFGGSNEIKRFQPVPSGTHCREDSVHHCACYVMDGSSEGRIIRLGMFLRNDTFKLLSWIKSFGSADESWMIARAVDAALSSILFYGEIPEIVDMSDKMPRQQRWHRETNLCEKVTVATTLSSLTVSTEKGDILDHRDWSEHGINAKFYVESRVKDWTTVLTNMKAQFQVTQDTAAPQTTQ